MGQSIGLDYLAACDAAAMATVAECAGNVNVYLYIAEKDGEGRLCVRPSNPFLGSDVAVQLAWKGCGTVVDAAESKQEGADGRRAASRWTITIPSPPIYIELGWWAWFEVDGRWIGGELIRVDRSGGFAEVIIDSAKSVPFSPALVGLVDEKQEIQQYG